MRFAVNLLGPHLFSVQLEIQACTSLRLYVVLKLSTRHIVLTQVIELHHQVALAYPLEALGCRQAQHTIEQHCLVR